MYFQLEVDHYSNEANKNKYKNVQLIALLLGLQSTLLLGLGVT